MLFRSSCRNRAAFQAKPHPPPPARPDPCSCGALRNHAREHALGTPPPTCLHEARGRDQKRSAPHAPTAMPRPRAGHPQVARHPCATDAWPTGQGANSVRPSIPCDENSFETTRHRPLRAVPCLQRIRRRRFTSPTFFSLCSSGQPSACTCTRRSPNRPHSVPTCASLHPRFPCLFGPRFGP